jgi:hypothetical protein
MMQKRREAGVTVRIRPEKSICEFGQWIYVSKPLSHNRVGDVGRYTDAAGETCAHNRHAAVVCENSTNVRGKIMVHAKSVP